MIEYIIGFDFGHGETSGSYIPLTGDHAGKCFCLSLRRSTKGDERKIMSVIYKTVHKQADGTIRYTYSLVKAPHSMPCLAFKDKVSNLNKNPQRREAYRAFIREVYRNILENNDFLKEGTAEDPDGNFLLYIACPTRWNEQEKSEYKAFFEEALAEVTCGRKVQWVINESDAAFFAHRRDGLVLVIDYGSSTIDYTLMHDYQKFKIDHVSCNLGASQVEQLMLADYKKNSSGKGSYAACSAISRQVLDEWMDVDSFLALQLRKAKEQCYSEEDSMISFQYALDYDFNKITNDNEYAYRCRDLDALLREEVNPGRNDCYMARVEQNFRELRQTIETELEKRDLRLQDLKFILSGGATIMPWVRNLVMNVFGVRENEMKTRILRDDNPSYVVSDGVAKYAYAKYDIAVTILGSMDEQLDYWDVFSESRTDALLECQVEDLNTLRDTYVRHYSTYNDLIPLLKKLNATLTDRQAFFQRVNERFNKTMNALLSKTLHDVFLADFGKEVDVRFNIVFPEIKGDVDSSYLDTVFKQICDSEHFFEANMDKPRSTSEREAVIDKLIECERNNPFICNSSDEFKEDLKRFVQEKILETIDAKNLFELTY